MADDWFFGVLAGVCVLLLVGLVGGIGYSIWWNANYRCVASHQEWRPAWTQMLIVGKTLIPIYHPAGYVTVCDKWERKTGDTVTQIGH